jgi:hypothetical protein
MLKMAFNNIKTLRILTIYMNNKNLNLSSIPFGIKRLNIFKEDKIK